MGELYLFFINFAILTTVCVKDCGLHNQNINTIFFWYVFIGKLYFSQVEI